MEEKVKAMLVGMYMMPAAAKAALQEMGAEFDQLRTEVDQVKTQLKECCKCK